MESKPLLEDQSGQSGQSDRISQYGRVIYTLLTCISGPVMSYQTHQMALIGSSISSLSLFVSGAISSDGDSVSRISLLGDEGCCWVCQGNDDPSDLFYPCNCQLHRKCIKQWVAKVRVYSWSYTARHSFSFHCRELQIPTSLRKSTCVVKFVESRYVHMWYV